MYSESLERDMAGHRDGRRRSCYVEDETALLFDSPSRGNGVSAAVENTARRYGVRLQRIAGKLLALYVFFVCAAPCPLSVCLSVLLQIISVLGLLDGTGLLFRGVLTKLVCDHVF